MRTTPNNSQSFSARIKRVHARQILDSRGLPTVETEVWVEDPKFSGEMIIGRASVPSGASTGAHEALELRDGDAKKFLGKGVMKAVGHVEEKIAPAIVNQDFSRLSLLDDRLMSLDGTANKSELGANAILSVSMAFTRAVASALRIPVYQLIAEWMGTDKMTLPTPLMNVINGGKHADNGLNFQEFMIVPSGFTRFSDALRAGAEVFQTLKKLLHQKGLSTSVGDEGGFAPVFQGKNQHEQAIQILLQAIGDAGYRPGKDIFLALDCASSELDTPERPAVYRFEGKERSSEQMIKLFSEWVDRYPIVSIEDGLSERDWEGWQILTQALGKTTQIVGDDLFVTNTSFLKKGIETRAANAILIKLNQIGTVTETLEAIRLAQQSGFSAITSHRSGETEDTFIADLAVGSGCGQIKTGSLSRSDRTAKYNQLLRIEENLGKSAVFAGKSALAGA